MSENTEKSSREKLLEALTIMNGGISYMYPYDEARVLRAWADALMAIESEEDLRNGYRRLYASFGENPSNFEEHMARVLWIFSCLHNDILSMEA